MNLLTSLFSIVFLAGAPAVDVPQGATGSALVQGSRLSSGKQELILYYASYCPYSQKVLSYLTQIGKTLPMRSLEAHPEAREELKTLGGKAQVPCLVIDGKPLYQSDDIIAWISEHQDQLQPAK